MATQLQPEPNSITEFRNTNNGYVKFDGTYGLGSIVGDNTNKPATYREAEWFEYS